MHSRDFSESIINPEALKSIHKKLQQLASSLHGSDLHNMAAFSDFFAANTPTPLFEIDNKGQLIISPESKAFLSTITDDMNVFEADLVSAFNYLFTKAYEAVFDLDGEIHPEFRKYVGDGLALMLQEDELSLQAGLFNSMLMTLTSESDTWVHLMVKRAQDPRITKPYVALRQSGYPYYFSQEDLKQSSNLVVKDWATADFFVKSQVTSVKEFFQNDELKLLYEKWPSYFITNTLVKYFVDRDAKFSPIPFYEANTILTITHDHLLLTITFSNIKFVKPYDNKNQYDLPGEIMAVFQLDQEQSFKLQSVHTSTRLLANIIDGTDVLGLDPANFQPNKRHLHDNLVYEAVKEDREFLSSRKGYHSAMDRLTTAIATFELDGKKGPILEYSKDLQSYVSQEEIPFEFRPIISEILNASAELLFTTRIDGDTRAALKKLSTIVLSEKWARSINETVKELLGNAQEYKQFENEQNEYYSAYVESTTALYRAQHVVDPATIEMFADLRSMVYHAQFNALPYDMRLIISLLTTATELLTKITEDKDSLAELKSLESIRQTLHERSWATQMEASVLNIEVGVLKIIESSEDYKKLLTESGGYDFAQLRLTTAIDDFKSSDMDALQISKALQEMVIQQKHKISADDQPIVNAILAANAELLNAMTAGEDTMTAITNLNAARLALPDRKWAVTLGALALALIGAAILTAAVMITVHSGGILTPISVILGQKGVGLMILGITMAVAGTALVASSTFFALESGEKPKLREDLEPYLDELVKPSAPQI